MQAIILAAGKGSRLDSLNFNCPKCLVPIANKPIIDYTIDNLLQVGVDSIYIVINHLGDQIKDHLLKVYPEANFIFIDERLMPQVDHNNIYSFNKALDMVHIEEDLFLIEGDIIFDKQVLIGLIGEDSSVALSEPAAYLEGGAIELLDNKCIKRVPFGSSQTAYKTINIYYFKAEHLMKLCKDVYSFIAENGYNYYYEEAFNWLDLKPVIYKASDWYEIDTPEDYYVANIIYAQPEAKYKQLVARYGGHWRIPGLIDCCYPNNPFFKLEKLFRQLKYQIPEIISSYPWGEQESRKLAANLFNLPSYENILVGTGASELISVLGQYFKDKTLYTTLPTFNEYLEFFNTTESFEAADIILIVNPGNPSGQVKSMQELTSLISLNQNKLFIIDESFMDFADSSVKVSFINSSFDNVLVIKSLGKSYGINGLKLGILTGNNALLISLISKLLPSWNLNSIAQEFLAQIICYKEDYKKACLKLIQERNRFVKELSEVKQIKVINTQTDFILVELSGKPEQLCIDFLAKYNIFIKDLSTKIGITENLIRLSINSPEINDFVVACFKEYFNVN